MKQQLLITIAALVLVGCGESVPDIDINLAASTGDIEAVKQYLAGGGDVNAKDEESTPLYWAAYEGQKEIVELLIANGADVNLRSGMVVKTKDESDGEQMAQKIANDRTPLDMAIFREHNEIAELLIAKGADVNAKDDDGDTPLDYAHRRVYTEVAALLRKHGGKTAEELKDEGN